MFELWLSVHVVCAVLWVGGGATIHVLGRMYAREGDPAAMLDFNRRAVALSTRLYAPAAVLLLIAGVVLVEEVEYEWSAPWIALGLLGWVAGFLVAVLFYPAERRRIDRAVESEGATSATAAATLRRVLIVNSVEVLILLLVVVDMAVKPD